MFQKWGNHLHSKVTKTVRYMSQTYLQTCHNPIKKWRPSNSGFNKHNIIRTAKANRKTTSPRKLTCNRKLTLFKSVQWKTCPLSTEEGIWGNNSSKNTLVQYKCLIHDLEKLSPETASSMLKYTKILFENINRNCSYRGLIRTVSTTNRSKDKCFSRSLGSPPCHLQQKRHCYSSNPKKGNIT